MNSTGMLPQTAEIYEELHATLRHYDTIHRRTEDTRNAHTSIEREVADIRRAYTAKLNEEIAASPEVKIKFSNAERREAEVQRRLESDISDLLAQEQEARTLKQGAAAELERSQEALKTYRTLAGLVESERRMEAVMTDVASMPRIVRR